MSFFGRTEVVRTKRQVTDIVTKADLVSQEVIIGAIKKKYPRHGIVSEESKDYKSDSGYIWYIDPLDGTKNFASRVPLFGINMALASEGKIKCAAIYLPATQELCYAAAGTGTYLNGKKIECSAKKDWLGTYGLGPTGDGLECAKFQRALHFLSKGTGWVNLIGSPAVCGVWVADGRRDWYIGPSKNSWDYAAPWLVAKEAGCAVSNFAGAEWNPGDRGLVLANKYLSPKLLEIIKISFLCKK